MQAKIVAIKEDESKQFYKFYKDLIGKSFVGEYGAKTIKFFFEKPFNAKFLDDHIKQKNVLAALANDEYVGFILFNTPEGGIMYVPWLAIDEAYRKQGLATKLLKALETEAMKRGVHGIMLCTEDWNIEFYEKRGFTFMGVMPQGYYGAKDNYMYKMIQKPKAANYLSH